MKSRNKFVGYGLDVIVISFNQAFLIICVLQVKLVRLVGIMLLFYVKAEHAAHISEVEAETVGTGVMGRMVSGVCFYENNQLFRTLQCDWPDWR